MCFYFTLLALRVLLYIYCVSTKLAKCAVLTGMFLLLPLHFGMTIAGTIFYARIRRHDIECYPEEASPWTVIFSLSVGWFLVYIYMLQLCTLAYNKVRRSHHH